MKGTAKDNYILKKKMELVKDIILELKGDSLKLRALEKPNNKFKFKKGWGFAQILCTKTRKELGGRIWRSKNFINNRML